MREFDRGRDLAEPEFEAIGGAHWVVDDVHVLDLQRVVFTVFGVELEPESDLCIRVGHWVEHSSRGVVFAECHCYRWEVAGCKGECMDRCVAVPPCPEHAEDFFISSLTGATRVWHWLAPVAASPGSPARQGR